MPNIEMEIDTGMAPPIKAKVRPLNNQDQIYVKKQIADMLKAP